jgi:uncharacterized protein
MLMGLTLAAGLATVQSAFAQPATGTVREARTIRVTGTGEVRVEPDLATVQFAVETTGTTAQQAGQANADAMDRVIRALTGAGIRREDIRTSGYSLFPEYVPPSRGFEDEPPRIRGYRAMNQVSVRTTELARLGQLIDVALEAGSNRLNGVFFEVRDPRRAQADALRRAVEDARTAAETIALALGVALGPVLDASTNADPVRPVFRVMAEAAMDSRMAAAPTPIEPGEQTVYATASVVFQIQ